MNAVVVNTPTLHQHLTSSSTFIIHYPSSTSCSHNLPSTLSLPRRPLTTTTTARRSANRTWLRQCLGMDRSLESSNSDDDDDNDNVMIIPLYGTEDDRAFQIPTQAQSLVKGSQLMIVSDFKPPTDVDYLQELIAIQQQGPRNIGFFGTINMGFMHQELIEILSYAMIITKNHIFTSRASGTNAAVIGGALRAEKPEFLTVILPQSLKKQPPESQELLSKFLCALR